MAELRHKKCGGIITINIERAFTLKTHSMAISPVGISVGVLELAIGNDKSPIKPEFSCNICQRKFEILKGNSEIESKCLVCVKIKPLEDLWVSYHFPCICSSCKDALMGDDKNPSNESVRKILPYFSLKSSGIEFVKLSDILSKKIEI